VAKIGGGAAGGALIGGLIGGGKSAAIGAGAGGAGGTGAAAATGKRQAVIPAESVITFTITGSKWLISLAKGFTTDFTYAIDLGWNQCDQDRACGEKSALFSHLNLSSRRHCVRSGRRVLA